MFLIIIIKASNLFQKIIKHLSFQEFIPRVSEAKLYGTYTCINGKYGYQ